MDNFFNSALFWFLLGIFFLLVEITHWGFVLFFFGLGSFLVAILTWTGLIHSPVLQLIIFIISSLLFLFVLRNKLSSVFKGKVAGKDQSVDEIKGEKVKVAEKIDSVALTGKVEFHGTIWQAESDTVIEKGDVAEITGRDNLILKVKLIPTTKVVGC